MGSATTQALAAGVQALGAAKVDLDTARELFAAARAVSGSQALSGALADPAAAPEARSSLVSRVFGSLSSTAQSLLTTAAAERWSSQDDLVDGIEELAVRAAAVADRGDLEGELFRVSRIVAENPELELALGSRLGDGAAKGALMQSLLGGRAGEATTLVVSSLVQHPRGRRVRAVLARAIRVVAAQRGRTVATVTTAAPLTAAQGERLATALSRTYGGEVTISSVVDPSIVGGVRVQIADDVIDGSIASRLAGVRQQLAG
ncbi:F0F1 ATP synthase subunit delta [Microbacterium marinilacus]|uniref:ATP synthase subunit delta n=1 Tax=Microbacterium marinilacus TaxID=415209 RepID=A0ABP7BNV3_9MICO|nr:F0F1 ATP synthase subunit delta [Microbacterium marinilacus]MBY0690078.1 F0F1 ATP synthase subunit delta [Microbacterium marinilacus]